MKTIYYMLVLMLFLSINLFSQVTKDSISLFNNKNLNSINVTATEDNYLGRRSLKVAENELNADQVFVKINNLDFKNGIIELDIAGKPNENASAQARGFVGIAFRINKDQ